MASTAFARWLLAVAALATAMAARADGAIVSSGPDHVAVTIYGDSHADYEYADWNDLYGYALITEDRVVDIPAGRSVLRFEGVAAGMMPESAILRGLPAQVREKNLDADLLSPGSLYDRSLGRRVLLRRTDPNTGKVSQVPAIVRSGLSGAAIVQTKDGFEAADCGPQGEDLVYPTLPAGLSPRPTLSVEVDSPAPVHAKIALSYLAWGFEWKASYLVQMHEGDRSADILAWVTLASSDSVSFKNADVAVVGGKVSMDDDKPDSSEDSGNLEFQCFFRPLPEIAGTEEFQYSGAARPDSLATIVVTGTRIRAQPMDPAIAVTAVEEGLGDLKLFRMPVPTTLASNAQKQVALFYRKDVKLQPVYVGFIGNDENWDPGVSLFLWLRNRKADGLGMSLPLGHATVFDLVDGIPVQAGEGRFDETPVDQDNWIYVEDLDDDVRVRVEIQSTKQTARRQDFVATVTNPYAWPIEFVGDLEIKDGDRLKWISAPLGKDRGQDVWKVTIPARGTATLSYRVALGKHDDD